MGKIIGIINKKTGELTLKTEGIPGEACLEATKGLRDKLGIDAEPEKTSEYYQEQQTDTLQQNT